MPTRSPSEEVPLVKCAEGYACLDINAFKKLLRNQASTDAYIKQLERLLKELAEPVK